MVPTDLPGEATTQDAWDSFLQTFLELRVKVAIAVYWHKTRPKYFGGPVSNRVCD